MSEQHTIYPNISWAQFEMFNDNRTDAFEEMCNFFLIGFYVEDSSAFDEVVIPKLKALIPSKLQETDLQNKVGLETIILVSVC